MFFEKGVTVNKLKWTRRIAQATSSDAGRRPRRDGT